MELLLAFLISFGVVDSNSASTMTKAQLENAITKNDLDKEYLIWEAEGDDF